MTDGKSSWLARLLGRLLPAPRSHPVPYSAIETVCVFILMWAVWPMAGYLLVTETGLGARLYGPAAMKSLRAKDRPKDDLIRERVVLAAVLITFPFQLLTAPLLLRFLSGTRPYHFGLTSQRLRDNALLGLLGWMVLTPPVHGINWAITEGFKWLAPDNVGKHGFERLSQSESVTGGELGLILFLAVVVAPIVEEISFRGVIQTWLTTSRSGAHFVMVMVFCLAFPMDPEKWTQLNNGDWLVLAPPLFVLLMVPGYLLVSRRQRTPAGTALYATSMLFGMVHQAVWPSPIALFVLALGLGWLALQTGSLVGPMVLHSLFNGVACVHMLLLR